MSTLALTLTLLLALSKEDERMLMADSIPAVPPRHLLAEAGNAQGIATFRQAALAEPGTNLVVSPLALSMSRNLFSKAGDVESFHAATLAHLRDTTRELFVRIGQRLWERQPDSQALDAWAFKTSGAAIKSLGRPAGPVDSGGFLSQVFYLQGYWLDLRGRSRREFLRPDGTVHEVPMLHFDEPYVHVDSVRIVQVPFAEGRYSLVLVVPDSGRSADQVIEGLEEEDWRIWMALRPLIRSQGAFPELHLHHIASLRSNGPPLRFGIQLTVGNDKHKWMHPRLERVFQSPFAWKPGPRKPMEVRLSDPHAELNVDRPFLFAIRDTRSGLLLMLGRVTDPARARPTGSGHRP